MNDIVAKLDDLILQATKERSHYYVASCAREARAEIERLQEILRSTEANRYWEGRWRDEKTEKERLQTANDQLRSERNHQTIVAREENEKLRKTLKLENDINNKRYHELTRERRINEKLRYLLHGALNADPKVEKEARELLYG